MCKNILSHRQPVKNGLACWLMRLIQIINLTDFDASLTTIITYDIHWSQTGPIDSGHCKAKVVMNQSTNVWVVPWSQWLLMLCIICALKAALIWKRKRAQHIVFKQCSSNSNKSLGEHCPSYWRICATSLKKINPTFKADGEINSNEGKLASWANEVYYYPTASAAAADDYDDTDEDRSNIQIFKSLSRDAWSPLVPR